MIKTSLKRSKFYPLLLVRQSRQPKQSLVRCANKLKRVSRAAAHVPAVPGFMRFGLRHVPSGRCVGASTISALAAAAARFLPCTKHPPSMCTRVVIVGKRERLIGSLSSCARFTHAPTLLAIHHCPVMQTKLAFC